MSARRLLNLVYGMTVENLDDDKRAEFDAALTLDAQGWRRKRNDDALAAIELLGGEIAS
jgi:hypothetical protein